MNSSVILPSHTGHPRSNDICRDSDQRKEDPPPGPVTRQRQPRVEVFAILSPDADRPGLDLHIHVLCPRRAERREAYLNVYLTELSSPGRDWVPGHPFTYPSLCSRPIPFEHVMKQIKTRRPYLGVLISLCDPGHRELDWSCRVFRTEDGALALDRRYGRR